MIGPGTMLPELFRLHPQTRAVFNRYGLRGCGGQVGPAETIEFFARAHGVSTDQLLGEITAAIDDPVARQAAGEQLRADSRLRLSDSIYRPFFATAMLVMLTAGALWGTFILWRIGVAGSYTGPTAFEINSHGHGQIMGWVGLFIMGFALQAFPRMWQVDLPAPRLALATWLAAVVGLTLRSVGLYYHSWGLARELHLLGGFVQLLAVGAFAAILVTAFRRSGQAIKPYTAFMFAAIGFMLLQVIYSGWHMDRLIAAMDRETLLEQLATFQAPLRDLQIHGMALLMILGVGLRMFPAIYGVSETSDRRAWLGWGLLVGAVLLEVVLFVTYRTTENVRFAAMLMLPWLMLPTGAALIVWPWKLWRALPPPGHRERSGKFVRASFAWLFIALTLLLLLPVYQLISGIAFSHAYYGAIRHAITVGFVSLMIVGMAAKVVPTLRGIDPGQLPPLWIPFVLINTGCLLRVSFQVATDWHPVFFKLVGISGMLEWTGFAIWAAHVSAVMFGWRNYRQPAIATARANWGDPPQRLTGEEKVAAVLAWYPKLESVFDAHGFTAIKNPVLRRTVATQVSLRQACKMKGVELDTFLGALNTRRPLPVIDGCPPPLDSDIETKAETTAETHQTCSDRSEVLQ